jgi:prepilin-type N-terminal cleavage/methylation domain-containing protein
MRNHHYSGYTLVELSVALTLAGVVVLASVSGTTWLLDQQRINEVSTQNADAIKRLNDAYDQLPNYAGLSLRQAVSFGAFRRFVINQAGTPNVAVTHPFSGAVGVATLNGAPLTWGLYLNSIPARYCTDLLFQSDAMSDALVVFPGGMVDPIGWAGAGGVTVDASVPAITIAAGFAGAAPRIVKNLTQNNLVPAALAAACNGAGDNIGVLLLKSKLR